MLHMLQKIIMRMEQSRQCDRYSILHQINHRKMRSFQLHDYPQPWQKENKTAVLLKNSKSSIDFHNSRNIQDFTIEQPALPKILTKNNRKTTTINFQEKEARQKFFNKVYNHKISKLITSNTAQQRERYMRKLNQALSDDCFRAIGYQFDESYIKFINELLAFSVVTTIVLDNNPLGDAGVIKLTTVFSKIPLKELSLASVNMGNLGASALFTSLKDVKTLTKLNLSTGEPINKNKLTVEGGEPLRRLLNCPTCSLDTLHLDHVQLGSEGARAAFEGVTNATLQNLSLSKNDIGIKNISNFIFSLAKVPLMRLDLSKNSIRDPGLKCLVDALGTFYSKNSISMNLSYLNLSANGITSQGFQFFCREMSGNRTLENLIMDENPLGDGDRFFNIKYYLSKNWGLKKLSLINISPCEKDLKFICEGMQSNRSLQQLSLSKNEVDCEILSFIFLMLTKNKSLRRISLNNCKISDNYLLKNEYMINNNFTAIEEIDLENNYINIKGAEILKKIITINQNILKLSLSKNCIPETSIDQINDILKENQSKRPFEHELHYFYSVSDLYEEKKKALKSQVEKIKKYEQKLQTHLLAEQIQFNLNLQENLKKRITKEQSTIRKYELKLPVRTFQIDEQNQQTNFITSFPQRK